MATVSTRYVPPEHSLIESFQSSIGSYTNAGGSGSHSLSSSFYLNGSQSLYIESNSATNYNVDFPVLSPAIDLTKTDNISFLVYLPDVSSNFSFTFYVSTQGGNFGKFFSVGKNFGNYKVGWNNITLIRSELTTGNSATWNTVDRFRIRVTSTTGVGGAYFNGLWIGSKERPKFMFHFDDGFQSVIDNALPILSAAGFKATIGATKTLVGGSGYASAATLQSVYSNDGWDIVNHANTHVDHNTLSYSDALSSFITCRDYLRGLGFNRSSEHVIYPVADPNSTTISAAKAAGALSGRSATPRLFWKWSESPEIMSYQPGVSAGQGTVAATVNASIDTCIKYGGLFVFYAHEIKAVEDAANVFQTSKLQTIVDHLIPRQRMGLIDVGMTVSEYFSRGNSGRLTR